MTTMLEKAARALAFTTADHKHTEESWWATLSADEKAASVDMALTVLMAVREPDEGASEAGNLADYVPDEGCSINFLNSDGDPQRGWPATKIVFTAMIDHILSEGGDGAPIRTRT